jgi:hypothetical protein
VSDECASDLESYRLIANDMIGGQDKWVLSGPLEPRFRKTDRCRLVARLDRGDLRLGGGAAEHFKVTGTSG